jgi:inorganic pyrophosphatase
VTALDRLPYVDEDGRLRAVIESPQGCRHKFKYEPMLEAFSVHASLPAGMEFPFDFGFFPSTRAADGDPLDVLILMDAPAFPGTLVTLRLLGVIEAEQSDDGGKPYRNDRLVAVADGTTERGSLRRLGDLDPQLMSQIETFFETYAGLTGKRFRAMRDRGPRRARRLLDAAALPTASPARIA